MPANGRVGSILFRGSKFRVPQNSVIKEGCLQRQMNANKSAQTVTDADKRKVSAAGLKRRLGGPDFSQILKGKSLKMRE